jgi:hypothetical protein
MTSTTSSSKIAIEREQQLYTEHDYTELKSANDEKGILMRKLIISLPLLTTMLTAVAIVVAAGIPAAASAQTIFESEEDGFRLQVPQGWVIQDEGNQMSPDGTSELVAALCPEDEALPGIGGESNCQQANTTDIIYINRWADLQSRPEFEGVEEDEEEGVIITTNDLVAIRIQELENSTQNLQIQNSTDVNEFTRIVTMTYDYLEQAGTFLPFDDYTYPVKSTSMFVLSPDRNTGYIILNNIGYENQTAPAVHEVFNTFGLTQGGGGEEEEEQ